MSEPPLKQPTRKHQRRTVTDENIRKWLRSLNGDRQTTLEGMYDQYREYCNVNRIHVAQPNVFNRKDCFDQLYYEVFGEKWDPVKPVKNYYIRDWLEAYKESDLHTSKSMVFKQYTQYCKSCNLEHAEKSVFWRKDHKFCFPFLHKEIFGKEWVHEYGSIKLWLRHIIDYPTDYSNPFLGLGEVLGKTFVYESYKDFCSANDLKPMPVSHFWRKSQFEASVRVYDWGYTVETKKRKREIVSPWLE